MKYVMSVYSLAQSSVEVEADSLEEAVELAIDNANFETFVGNNFDVSGEVYVSGGEDEEGNLYSENEPYSNDLEKWNEND